MSGRLLCGWDLKAAAIAANSVEVINGSVCLHRYCVFSLAVHTVCSVCMHVEPTLSADEHTTIYIFIHITTPCLAQRTGWTKDPER